MSQRMKNMQRVPLSSCLVYQMLGAASALPSGEREEEEEQLLTCWARAYPRIIVRHVSPLSQTEARREMKPIHLHLEPFYTCLELNDITIKLQEQTDEDTWKILYNQMSYQVLTTELFKQLESVTEDKLPLYNHYTRAYIGMETFTQNTSWLCLHKFEAFCHIINFQNEQNFRVFPTICLRFI